MTFFLRFVALLLLLNSDVAKSPAQGIIADPTTWTSELKQVKGNNYKLIFHVKLLDQWHIWSLKPGGDGMQIAPNVQVNPSANYKLNGPLQEAGKKITSMMEGIDGAPASRYEHAVDFIQPLIINKAGKITGKYSYQVCNEQTCLPPKSKSFSVEAKGNGLTVDSVAGSAIDTTSTAVAAIPPVTKDTASAIAPSANPQTGLQTTAAAKNPKTDAAATQSNIILLLEGLGAGIISVLTPCVFAMLPMTVSFFLKRSKDRKTGVKIAMQYSLSIVLIFTIIGGLFAAFLKQDTLHAFSTNWIVNLVFAIVFIVFGISFFGAFEISLPSSWATKMDTKANTRNFAGIFFMALTLVIVSFSCTGPFISFMLKLMDNGRKIGPLIGFFGYGLGLALPFALFAIFPSLLNTLGKQGGWLNVVKVTFGFIELALALKFLSNADVQKGWRLLDREIFLAIWIVLSFLLGGYLLGAFRFAHDSEMPKNDWGLPYLKVPRFLFATCAIIFGFYLLPGMWGAPLNAMGAFVPPMGTQDFVLGGETATALPAAGTNGDMVMPVKYVAKMKLNEPPVVVKYKMTIFFDYAEALAASKKTGKPVMLDFTGINCANCRKMETGVWSDPEVMRRLKDDFILASLYCDANAVELPKEEQFYAKSLDAQATTLGEKNQDLEITQFGTNALPTYFFVDASGTRLYDKGIGYPTSVSDFVKILEEVKAKNKSLHP